jgi:glycosyltransferase involved in cell wall biosynthesis
MKVSFVIPIFNEEEFLEDVLSRVRALPLDKELVLIDDGSDDRTVEILAAEESKPDTIVIHHKQRSGKGAGIRTGLRHATGDIVIVQDADLEYSPEEVPSVIQPIIDGKTNVAYGSRFKGRVTGMRFPNYIANRSLSFLTTILYGQAITDLETAYKAMRREVAQSIDLTRNDFAFDPEITSHILRSGERIVEVPISYKARTFEQGKKIGWRDFFAAVSMLIRVRFMKIKKR